MNVKKQENRTMVSPDYIYRATLERVVDGDTLIVIIDIGFDVQIRAKLRLLEVNAPKVPTQARLMEILSNSKEMIIYINKRDCYGHWLGKAWLMMSGRQICLNELLADEKKQ